ncbi:MAG: DUF4019 domain-containing protein [Burkholderiales bacterium]|nr:DUF4019 domain-containing protein [Burkholderiales bacterium]
MKASRFTLLAFSLLLAATGALAQMKIPGLGTSSSPSTPSRPLFTAPPAAAGTPAAPSASSSATDSEAEKEAAAQLAAGGWLVLLDRRDWGRAWESSSSVFRTSVPLGTWMDGIPKAREPLGALVERIPDEAHYRATLEGRPAGDYVTVIFSSKFASKEDAKEVVTMVREPDGKWRATGYSTR